MPEYTRTRLWKAAFEIQPGSEAEAAALDRLTSAYTFFRDRCAVVAAEIARDLPEFTVHDVTHLDALWEMADLVAGDAVTLTPVEGFVLGGTFLIHDLGMGLAAFPDGRDGLRRDPKWPDILAAHLKTALGHRPSQAETLNAPKEDEVEAFAELLRIRHAAQSERVIAEGYGGGGQTYYLIEDPEIRKSLGPTIGQVAHSHWWSIDEVRRRFGEFLSCSHLQV